MSPCQLSSALSPCCSLAPVLGRTLSPTPTRRAAQEEGQCSPLSGRDRDTPSSSPCLAGTRVSLASSSNRTEVPRSGAQNSAAQPSPSGQGADSRGAGVSALSTGGRIWPLSLVGTKVGGHPFPLPCGQGPGPSPCPILEAMKNPRLPKRGLVAGTEGGHWRMDPRWTPKG